MYQCSSIIPITSHSLWLGILIPHFLYPKRVCRLPNTYRKQSKEGCNLSRVNLSTSKKLNSRINIKKTSRINKWASVSFQFTVISFTSKKPTNLFTHTIKISTLLRSIIKITFLFYNFKLY